MHKIAIMACMQDKLFLNEIFDCKNLAKGAFTLAEVLITLGIIGVVAALTVPTLMQNADERANVAALKKAYSTISQAYKLAVNEDGTPDTWGLSDMSDASQPGSRVIIDKLSPYLRVQKDCGTSGGCFANVTYNALNGGDWINPNTSTKVNIMLVDGVSMTAWSGWAACDGSIGTMSALQNLCGSIEVDINGFKKPNKDGVDYFVFWISKQGVVPNGLAGMPATSNSFEGGCKDITTAGGHGCAAWVIYNNNMDYLHCPDLDWSTKTKCN